MMHSTFDGLLIIYIQSFANSFANGSYGPILQCWVLLRTSVQSYSADASGASGFEYTSTSFHLRKLDEHYIPHVLFFVQFH